MNAYGGEWEVIYVNDGSRDHSLPLLLQLQASDHHVVVVELSRNWGHQGALTAGLSVAKGDAVVTMDGDLQDHPSVIPRMIDRWRCGAQVVLAERRSRQDSGLKAMLYPIFYGVLGRLADHPIPMNSGIFGLIDRKVADQITSMPERNRYLPGLKTFVGFRTETIYYDRLARHAGEAKYTWKKLIKYAFDAIYSFSYKPLRLALVSGGTLLALTLFAGMLLLGGSFSAAFRSQWWFDYAAAGAAFFFVSGLQLTCMGFMGEYIGRIYDEVRQRPLFVIDNVRRASAAAMPYRIPEFGPIEITEPAFASGSVTAVENRNSGPTVVFPTPAAA
jgi:dolichol-phosphate mannosyltransferase